jgi:hypothetical protein
VSIFSAASTAHLHLVVTAPQTPHILRHCARCRATRPFASSGKFRVNAQKKLIDVWLIYRCGTCDQTWNFAVHERVGVNALSPDDLNAFMQNDAILAARHAGDLAALARQGATVAAMLAPTLEPTLERRLASIPAGAIEAIEITISAPVLGALRLDRVLALGLALQRSDIQRLAEDRALALTPEAPKALRRPARDGQRVLLDLTRSPPDLALKCRRSLVVP